MPSRPLRLALVAASVVALVGHGLAGFASVAAEPHTITVDASWLGGDRFRVTTTTTGCEAAASLRWDRDWRFPDPLAGGAVAVGGDDARTVTVAIPDDWPAVYVELRCDQSGPGHAIEAGAMAQITNWVPAPTPTPSQAAATLAPSDPTAPVASVAPGTSAAPAPGVPAWVPSGPLPGPVSALATSAAIGPDGTAVMVGMKAFLSGPMVAWVATDGATWSTAKVAGGKNGVATGVLALPSGGFLAFGGGQLWRSTDGTTWKAQKQSLKDAMVMGGTILGDGVVVLAGGAGFPPTPAVWSSPDGTTFTRADLPPVDGSDGRIVDVVQDATGVIVAASLGGAEPGAYWASADGGRTWTGIQTPDPTGQAAGIAALPSGFVTVINHLAGSLGDAVVLVSSDGMTWTESLRLPSTFLSAPVSISGGAMAAFGSRMYVTADGLTWTTVDDPALAAPAVIQGGQVTATGQGVLIGWTNGDQGTTAWTAPAAPPAP